MNGEINLSWSAPGRTVVRFEIPADAPLKDVVEAMGSFLVAIGYPADNVREYFSHD